MINDGTDGTDGTDGIDGKMMELWRNFWRNWDKFFNNCNDGTDGTLMELTEKWWKNDGTQKVPSLVPPLGNIISKRGKIMNVE